MPARTASRTASARSPSRSGSGTSSAARRTSTSRARRPRRTALAGHLAALVLLGGAVGLVAGRLLGILLAPWVTLPPLVLDGVPVGFDPRGEVDLGLMSLNLGLGFRPNLMILPGMAMGALLFHRYFHRRRRHSRRLRTVSIKKKTASR